MVLIIELGILHVPVANFLPAKGIYSWKHSNYVTLTARKSDIPLRSHVTLSDQRSTQKVRFFFPTLCTKQMAK